MALVIRRNDGQGILIGDDVWVYAFKDEKKPGRIKLVIYAPDNIDITREEILYFECKNIGPLFDQSS
jgi:sRNA-binding carbon storage regulator CsrA